MKVVLSREYNYYMFNYLFKNKLWVNPKICRDLSTLKSESIPECPRPSFIQTLFGLINHDKAKNLHLIVDQKHKQLGPIYRDHVGPVTAIFVNSPDIYKRIFRYEGNIPHHLIPEAWLLYNQIRQSPRGLLFMSGDEWLYHRKIMNKLLLSSNAVKEVMLNACEETASALISQWENEIMDNGLINDLERRLYQWSIEVMIATMMGSKWEEFNRSGGNESKELALFLHRIFELSAKLSLMPAKYAMKFKLPVWTEFVQVFDKSFSIINKLVMKMVKFEGDGLLNLMEKEGIEKENLFRIVSDLILAAGDTTAYSTQWTLFLLGKHPEVQSEMLKRLSSKSRVEIVNDSYIKGIMKESLRLYPIAPFLTRILPEDTSVDGYLISKGELILMSLYSSSRDPKNFPQPDEFRPERWLRNERGNLSGVNNAYGSIPFALGVRSCVGKKLAEIQMILTISKIVKQFKIECLNSERIKMILHLISVPSENVKLKLSSRKE